jgi:hypothetical protein
MWQIANDTLNLITSINCSHIVNIDSAVCRNYHNIQSCINCKVIFSTEYV